MTHFNDILHFFMVVVHFLLLPITFLVTVWKTITMGEGKSLEKQKVLITGAGNGLGRELTLQLIRQGCTIIGVDIREEDLNDTKQLTEVDPRSTGKMETYVCNIADRAQVAKLRDDVLNRFNSVDILINNASLLYGNTYDTGDDEHIEKVCKVNILGGMWITRAFLPSMKELSIGHIVFISSASAMLPHPQLTMYSATKCATTALARLLRESLEDNGKWQTIKVTTVHPTVIITSDEVKATYAQAMAPPMDQESAAKCIIKAIRNELEDVAVPGLVMMYGCLRLLSIAPKQLKKAFNTFFGTKFQPSSDTYYNDVINENKSYKAIFAEKTIMPAITSNELIKHDLYKVTQGKTTMVV